MKYTYEYVKQDFENNGYTLISTEYKNVKTCLKYICNKHKHRGVQEIRYYNFINGSRCPYCMIEDGRPPNHLPEIIYKEEAEKLGYVFISVEYRSGSAIINFICPNHKNKGIQQANWRDIRSGKNSCSYCNGTNRSTEDFKEIIRDVNPNIEIIGEYIGARKRIRCKCKIDGYEWEPFAYNLLSGFGCPKCADKNIGLKKRTSTEEKKEKLLKMHPNIEFITFPVLSSDLVECHCKICDHYWNATYSNLTKTIKHTGCPNCAGSNSENSLEKILKKWGYIYKKQKTYADCKDITKLPFDFYLEDFNVLIEFDGEHHYYPIPRGASNGEEEFLAIKKHDKIKNEYCKKNNIPLIRVPYWEREFMEYFLFEKFVELNVIEEIKHA